MQEEHELEMKAEELFNMTFGPLTWNPDDEDEAKDIVDCAVKDGLMERRARRARCGILEPSAPSGAQNAKENHDAWRIEVFRACLAIGFGEP